MIDLVKKTKPRTYPCSINKGIIDKAHNRAADTHKWENAELTAEELKEHIAKGFAFSCAYWKNPKEGRGAANFLKARLVALDIDNTITDKETGEIRCKKEHEGYFRVEDAVNDPELTNNAVMIYTTASHTPEHHKFRIVLSFQKTSLSATQFQETVLFFIRKYDADDQCKDVSRMYYGSSKGDFYIFDNLMTRSFWEAAKQDYHHEEPKTKFYREYADREIGRKHIEEMLDAIPPYPGYYVWLKIISAIGNYFESDMTTAVDIVENWSRDEDMGTARKMKYRLRNISIGTLIYFAKHYGYDINKIPGIAEANRAKNEGPDMTERGNSVRFYEQWKDTLRFNHNRGKWMIWDGTKWNLDEKDKHERYMDETVMKLKIEASQEKNGGKKKELYKWSLKSQSASTFYNSIKMAKGRNGFATLESDYNKHNHLFNLANGTYDLRDNVFKTPHQREDMITNIVDAEYKPDEDMGVAWDLFLATVFDDNQELIDFVQRAVGYTMNGNVSEEVLFFCYGTGKNGKSIFFNVLDKMFGDYGMKIGADTLMQRQNEGISNDLARIVGHRLVVSSELPESRRLNEEKVKDLTGHDKITARFLRQEFFDFFPTHTLWMYGNHKPIIKGTDEGIWRRILIIPFTVTISDDERRPADEIMDELMNEKSVILNWMIEGWKKYQMYGLQPPRIVTSATSEYRNENDIVQDFLEEFFDITNDPNDKILAKSVFVSYQTWCREYSERILGNRTFYRKLEEKGFKKITSTGNKKYITGLKFKPEARQKVADDPKNNPNPGNNSMFK